MDILVILASFIASLAFTAWVRQMLLRRNVLDQPNERSSHKIPVPRGGGWALVMVLLPGMILAGIVQHNLQTMAGLLAGIAVLTAISWLDDKRGMSAKIRLTLHMLAAWLGTLSLPHDATLFNNALPFMLDRAILIIGWAWFINLYNFMDGIDGITGAETIAIASGVCWIMTLGNLQDPLVSLLTLLLTGASLGFLAFNWHPARIFLGDVGSVPLGYLTGFCLLSLAVRGQLIPALILPLYYLADSGITITKRALRGEKIWQAHRQHFYQQAALALGRHDFVVWRIVGANIGLILAAIVALYAPWLGLGMALLIVALLLFTLYKAA